VEFEMDVSDEVDLNSIDLEGIIGGIVETLLANRETAALDIQYTVVVQGPDDGGENTVFVSITVLAENREAAESLAAYLRDSFPDEFRASLSSALATDESYLTVTGVTVDYAPLGTSEAASRNGSKNTMFEDPLTIAIIAGAGLGVMLLLALCIFIYCKCRKREEKAGIDLYNIQTSMPSFGGNPRFGKPPMPPLQRVTSWSSKQTPAPAAFSVSYMEEGKDEGLGEGEDALPTTSSNVGEIQMQPPPVPAANGRRPPPPPRGPMHAANGHYNL